MRNVPDGLGDCGTFCTLWTLTLSDKTVLGFTDHDKALTIDDVTYEAVAGLTGQGSSVEGVLTSDRINAADVDAGRYDGAVLTIAKANWADTSQSAVMSTGYLSDIRSTEQGFEADWIGLASKLDRSTGRVFSRTCDASFGDARCGLSADDFPEGTVCERTFKACQAFDNTANYRGFPYLLGDDALTRSPQEGEIFDGGSRYDNQI